MENGISNPCHWHPALESTAFHNWKSAVSTGPALSTHCLHQQVGGLF